MTIISRRTFLLFGAVLIPTAATGKVHSNAKNEMKARFIRRANKDWEGPSGLWSLYPDRALVAFKNQRYFYTTNPSVWLPNSGQNYKPVVVPAWFVTDLASVPQWAWSFGILPAGPYAYAAVIHDYLYWIQDRSRKEADKIFLIAMEDSKVEKTLRELIYKATVLAGEAAWKKNSELKAKGECRRLRKVPDDFTISWETWKARNDVCFKYRNGKPSAHL